ncbi:N-formimino-L-glutamate deiminase [Serratia fonticola]|uniref:N-formimino-L-glutamate deiminase n=1 Tax=Serratia fonticola TaxID=47917 RepID=A0A4U9WIR5_SERFO|nr:N-formimino-L-glutamate deiminase [Serratia fonticola]
MTLLPVLYSYAGFGAQPAQAGQRRFIQSAENYLEQQQVIARQLAGQPLQNQGLCFHSLRAVELGQMQQILAASDQTLPVHIHIAEQQKEVNDCLAWSGQRPVAWLYEHLPVDSRWCLVHATHLDREELEQLARSKAVAGLCPTTEANLGVTAFSLATVTCITRGAGGSVRTATFP